MIERGSAIEDEVVCAFLRAEIDSSRYGDGLKRSLAASGLNRSLIDAPSLTDPAENTLRRRLLDYRGYDRRQGLFTGFPFDVTWRRVDLEADDFTTMRYINDAITQEPNWTNLSDGTRLVSVGAANLRRHSFDSRFQQVIPMAQALRRGERFPPLIAAQYLDGDLVLIEGHSRATGYVMEGLSGLMNAFVGVSPSMNKWAFY